MLQPAVKLQRVKKYDKFALLVSEFYRGAEYGKKDGLIWVKIGKKKVWFDVFFKTHFGNRVWGGHKFMVYEVRYIRIHKIGKWLIPYNWLIEDCPVPANDNGYIHEQSELYALLRDLEGFVKRYGITFKNK